VLNSVEGSTRTSLNYMENLCQFHDQVGTPLTKIPQVDRKPVDLYLLKKEVHRRGGPSKVCQIVNLNRLNPEILILGNN
jgi:histone demethylase JARID1